MVLEVARKFARLPAKDRMALMRTVIALGAARVATWLLPFGVGRRLLVGTRRSRSPSLTPEQVRWAMSKAQRVVPQATCLPQALAAEALLTRSGLPAELQIGVKKTPSGKLAAHAWVVSDGRIVVGDLGRELATYTPLPTLPSVWPG
ncbi:MAG TPA: lasso peptide biosynthesis B2 protein [Gemmatimonadaceae bacterium]